jgi:hypothetical protein
MEAVMEPEFEEKKLITGLWKDLNEKSQVH